MSQQTILDELAAAARLRADRLKETVDVEALYERATRFEKRPFAGALAASGLSVVSEIKRASPSAGFIREVDPAAWGVGYEERGARCLSILTEPGWFKGSLEDLDAAREGAALPVLRKDFTVDEVQVIETATRADAVLLIASLFDPTTLARYIALSTEVGLSPVVEVHDEPEAEMAVEAGARIIGVNNRNLKDFSVDLGNFERLADRLRGAALIAESGVKSLEDARRLRDAGADAVLVGEAAMRDPAFVAKLSSIS